MKIADDEVAKLYGFDVVIGGEPTQKYAEKNVKVLENPYSLSDKGPESMFKQTGGRRRRSRKISRRSRKGTRQSRHH